MGRAASFVGIQPCGGPFFTGADAHGSSLKGGFDMKCKILLVCFMAILIAQPLFALTGREIMEKSDALPEPRTAMSRLLMLVYKGERVEEKEFTLQMKQYPNDEDKTLIAFLRPTQIKLLTHAHKGG